MKMSVKKNILFVVFSLVCFSFSGVAFAGSFPDVSEDHENYQSIQFLKDNGYIGGYADLTFKPENEINRAEAVKILVGALDIDQSDTSLVLFGDVVESDWFFPYVMGAYEADVIQGDSEGLFRPTDTINLAESLKIISEALSIDLPDLASLGGEQNVFGDVSVDDWFARYALFARENNILFMDDYGEVHPGDPMTRAEFAETMYRYIRVFEDGAPFPIQEYWSSYSSGTMPFEILVPENFEKFFYGDTDDEVVFWKSDVAYFQSSPERIYPNTAKLVVSLDDNTEGLSLDEYFSNVKMVFDGGQFSEFETGGFDVLEIDYPDQFVKDWYVYIDQGSFEGKVLVVYTQNGSGVLSAQYRKVLNTMMATFKYVEGVEFVGGGDSSFVDIKDEIFENILVEGSGQDMLNLLSDEIIIETDSIGVGTGPIDYYYSSEVDLTLKYERAGDVILDYRDGQTTAF